MEIREIAVSAIKEPEVRMRAGVDDPQMEAFVEDVKALGVLQPVGLVPRDGVYEVVWGDRRVEAARRAGLTRIPARVVEGSEEELERFKRSENYERRDVSRMEEACYFGMLLERWKCSQAELAEKMNVTEGYLSQSLGMLIWPSEILEAVELEEISWAVGRELVRVENELERKRLLAVAIDGGSTVRIVAQWVREYKDRMRGGEENGPVRSQGGRSTSFNTAGGPCHRCCGTFHFADLQYVSVCEPCAVRARCEVEQSQSQTAEE